MKIRFNNVDEFKAELKIMPPVVLRLTRQYEFSTNYPQLARLTVVATYLQDGNIVVRLDRHCGQTLQTGTDQADSRAAEIIKDLEVFCKENDVAVRAGIYEE